MLSDNKWLDNEIKQVNAERKLVRHKSWSNKFVLLFMLYISPILTSFVIMECPHCNKEFKAHWSSVWSCPTCGYENYDEMGYCSICGEKKPRKRGNYREED